jgi:hypothetical protein
MNATVFGDMAPCNLVDNYRCFDGKHHLCVEDRRATHSSPLKMEAERSSGISAKICQTTWRHTPEDGIVHIHVSACEQNLLLLTCRY